MGPSAVAFGWVGAERADDETGRPRPKMDKMTCQRHDVIMAEVLSVAEAKRRFSELIDRVGHGERFVVTRRGKPVLALVPAEESEAKQAERPLGLLSIVGAFADAPEFEEVMKDVVRQRRRSRGRPAPGFD